MPGEFEFIRWLRSQTKPHPRVLIGPGDDCAAVRFAGGTLVVTTDMLTEGVDFRLAETSARRIGRKAMSANLSDLAAMAATPVAAVVAVCLPHGHDIARELDAGLREVADAFDVPIVGGDTNSWPGGLVVSVTAFGEATARGLVRRSGAKPGDWLFVTGPLGGSLLGHHFDFVPRVREALALHEAANLHAMADISDGLAADLNHILEESDCGAVLFAGAIPIAEAAHAMSRTSGKTPLQHALGDGEDFELIFAVSPEDGARLAGRPGVWKVGECVERGLWLETAGRRDVLAPSGWVHALGPIQPG